MTTIKSSLLDAYLRLKNFSSTPQIDAQILLRFVLDVSHVYLFTYPERVLTQEEINQYEALIAKRLAGHPIAYLIGTKAFWSFDLAVTPATLIPRSESELLVEVTLQNIPVDAAFNIADLGTGSGALAVAMAYERPHCKFYGYDKSLLALEIAEQNKNRLGLRNVVFQLSDWLSELPEKFFDVIVSNPPYLAESDPHLYEGDLRFEPTSALVSGPLGTESLEYIIKTVPKYLKPGGILAVEHGYNQGEVVIRLFKDYGYDATTQYRDVQGHPRVTIGIYT